MSLHMNQLSSWLPDSALARMWGLLILCLSVLWSFLLISSSASTLPVSTLINVFFGVLLGIAYGSCASAIFLVVRCIAKRFDENLTLHLPFHRVVKVTLLMYLIHASSIGVLSLLGAWQEPWPWLLGVVPQLWH